MKASRSFFFIIFLFFNIGLVFPAAKNLNYMQAHLFRLSSEDKIEEWLIPLIRYAPSGHDQLNFNVMVSANPEVPDTIADLNSKDKSRTRARLDQSYGKPYDVGTKLSISTQISSFEQIISSNAGAVLIVHDPVFPFIEGIMFHDYTGTSLYHFKYKNLLLKPQVSYGLRRTLEKDLSVGDFVEKKIKIKFSDEPWRFYSEAGFLSQLSLDYCYLLFDLNAYPITQNRYNYWNSNLGIRSKNIVKNLDSFSLIRYLDLYFSYSPFYGGQYDVSRTVTLGTGFYFNSYLGTDIFLIDDYSWGILLKLNYNFVYLSLFTFKTAYDDYHNFESRQYGLNLKLSF